MIVLFVHLRGSKKRHSVKSVRFDATTAETRDCRQDHVNSRLQRMGGAIDRGETKKAPQLNAEELCVLRSLVAML